MNYKLTDDGVINLETGAYVPACEGNKDWQEYQEWAKTNTPFSLESVVEKVNDIWTDISSTDDYKAKIKKATNKEALTKRDKALDAFSTSLASNKIMLELGYITQEVYDARLAEDKADVAVAFAEFNTSLGITAPTITE